MTDAERRSYVGRYELRPLREAGSPPSDISTLDIIDENGRLTALLPGDPPEALTAVGDHRFVATARPDKHFTFVVRNGRVIRATFDSPEGTYEGAPRQ